MNSLQHSRQQGLEQQLPILFYSNFSPSSKNFLNLLNKYHLRTHIDLVCIDHKKFRERLSKSKVLKINKVPCVIKLYQGGTVEKYDDKAVFDWLDVLINRVTPPMPPPPPLPPQNTTPPQPPQAHQMHNSNVTVQPPVVQEQNREIKAESPMRDTTQLKPVKKSKTKSFGEGTTSIGDLMTDDDEEYEGSDGNEDTGKEPIRKPIKSLRSDSGNYEFEDFGEHEVRNNPNNLRGVKQNTETAAKSDIISLAQSMQKSRELEDSKTVNPSHRNLEKSRHKT